MPHKRKAAKQPKPMGRPTSYTDKIADEIITRLSAGESLTAICSSNHLPSHVTIYNWLDKPEFSDFLKRYTQAKARCAESLFYKQLDVAQASTKETLGPDRLKVETMDRMAAKLAPTKYSERYMAASISSENNRIDRIQVIFMPAQDRPEPVIIEHSVTDTASVEQDD